MEPLDADALAEGALLLVDTAPIIYTLEGNARFARRFAPLFQRHAAGELLLAVTTVTIAEVLVGPLRSGEEALARRYRAALQARPVRELTADVAQRPARLRAAHGLKLPDAVQVASALAIGADALVTHDRDFAPVRGLRILS